MRGLEKVARPEGSSPAAANVPAMYRKLSERQPALDEQIVHIRGLVFIRMLLAGRGATPAELAECDHVIAGCRRELAELAVRSGARASAAA